MDPGAPILVQRAFDHFGLEAIRWRLAGPGSRNEVLPAPGQDATFRQRPLRAVIEAGSYQCAVDIASPHLSRERAGRGVMIGEALSHCPRAARRIAGREVVAILLQGRKGAKITVGPVEVSVVRLGPEPHSTSWYNALFVNTDVRSAAAIGKAASVLIEGCGRFHHRPGDSPGRPPEGQILVGHPGVGTWFACRWASPRPVR
jgi:hypothetical protein